MNLDNEKEYHTLRKQLECTMITNKGIQDIISGIRCRSCGGRTDIKSQRYGFDICRCVK